jgi:hypothetical protein
MQVFPFFPYLPLPQNSAAAGNCLRLSVDDRESLLPGQIERWYILKLLGKQKKNQEILCSSYIGKV